MSTNCLVTKLKGSVDNDWLPKYGHLRVRARDDRSGRNIRITVFTENNVYAPLEVTCYGDNIVTHNTVAHQNETFNVDLGVSYGETLNINGTSNGGYVDINILKNTNTRNVMYVLFTNVYVDTDLETLVKIIPSEIRHSIISEGIYLSKSSTISEYLNIVREYATPSEVALAINNSATNCINDISESDFASTFADFTSATLLAIGGSFITSIDTIQNLASAQVANGRTEGTLRVFGISDGERRIVFDSSQPNGYTITKP